MAEELDTPADGPFMESVCQKSSSESGVPSLWPALPRGRGHLFSFGCGCSTDFGSEAA